MKSTAAALFVLSVLTSTVVARVPHAPRRLVGSPTIPKRDGHEQAGAPQAGPPSPTPTLPSYVIQQGDTLSRIADRFDVGICNIANLNRIQNPNAIIAETTILIPPSTGERDDTSCFQVCPTPVSPTGPAATGAFYTIQSGDTLGAIATNFNVGICDIAILNNITDPNFIVAGNTIRIPPQTGIKDDTSCFPTPPQESPTPLPTGAEYTIQAGDTLFILGRRFGVGICDIANLNNISIPNFIVAGNQIRIPPTTGIRDDTSCFPACPGASPTPSPEAPPSPPPGGQVYTVQAGDNLTVIAAKFEVGICDIANVNPSIQGNLNLIFPGQRLNIPPKPEIKDDTSCRSGSL